MNCPKCQSECHRDEVDVGVGVINGPYGCPDCGWSEDEKYDFSDGKSHLDERGGAYDQYGGYWPAGSSMALAQRLAESAKPTPLPGEPVATLRQDTVGEE